MQIVIDIPEEIYEEIKTTKSIYRTGAKVLCNAIVNGISLPKGHGRIGDLDALENEMINGIKAGNLEEGYEEYANINNMDDCVQCVKYADIIIEADEVESEDKRR